MFAYLEKYINTFGEVMEILNIAFLLVFAISCEHVVYCIVLYCIVIRFWSQSDAIKLGPTPTSTAETTGSPT